MTFTGFGIYLIFVKYPDSTRPLRGRPVFIIDMPAYLGNSKPTPKPQPKPAPAPRPPRAKAKAKVKKGKAGTFASAVVNHFLDLKVDSPRIRKLEMQAATRRGFKWAVGVIIAISMLALIRITIKQAFLQNPQFELRQIVVRTEGPLTVQKIVRTTALTEGTNLLSVNLRDVRTRLEHLPQVERVKVARDYTGALLIDVAQRIPVAWLECPRLGMTAGKAFDGSLVDANGIPFPCDMDPKSYAHLPIIRYDDFPQYTPGKAARDFRLSAALKLLAELQARFEKGSDQVRRIELQTPYSMQADFAGKYQVIFAVDDLDLQLARLDCVQEQVRQRNWKIQTLNLLARENVPIIFKEVPDLAGLQRLNPTVGSIPSEGNSTR